MALEKAGATELTLSTSGSNHQRFDFKVDGQVGRFVFASTPKSVRAVSNAEAVAKRTVQAYRTGRKNRGSTQGRGITSPLPC